MSNTVIKIDPEKSEDVKRLLLKEGAVVERKVEHALWSLKINESYVTFYGSGKVLIQGKEKDSIKDLLENTFGAKSSHDPIPHKADWYIGIDESGKGDTFGGIVVCGVMIRRECIENLKAYTIRDSKKLKDKKIEAVLKDIQKNVPHACIKWACADVDAETYNRLWSITRDVNLLLLNLYRKVLSLLLRHKKGEGVIYIDKFTDEERTKRFLNLSGRDKLIIESGGEKFMPVALASMMARYKFKKQIENIEKMTGIKIPLGSSDERIPAVLTEMKEKGFDLKRTAKLHFGNVNKIL